MNIKILIYKDKYFQETGEIYIFQINRNFKKGDIETISGKLNVSKDFVKTVEDFVIGEIKKD